MADSTNLIDIAVANNVDPQIAPRLLAIADASDKADKSVGSLKSQLASLQSSGLGSLLSQLTALQNVTSSVGRQQDTLAGQTKASGLASDAAAVALARQTAATAAQAKASAVLASQSDMEAAAYLQLAEATIAASTAKAALAQLSKDVTGSGLAEGEAATLLAAAMIAQSEATQQLGIAKANLSEVTTYLNEQSAQANIITAEGVLAAREQQMAEYQLMATGTMRARLQEEMGLLFEQNTIATNAQTAATERLALAEEGVATATNAASAATTKAAEANVANTVASNASASAANKTVSANVSAAAAIGILEGRTLSMNRAAANFATRILGLGPIFQQAFAVIGAVAMIAVLYQMGAALYKVYEQAKNAGREISKAFEEATTSLRRSNNQLDLSNDKLDATIAKLEHKPTSNGAVMALDEARVMADRLDQSLDEVGKHLDTILSKNVINVFGGLITGQKSTTEANKQIKERYEVLTQEAELSAQNRLEEAGKKVYATLALKQKAINDALAAGMNDRKHGIEAFKSEMERAQGQDSVLHMNQAGEKTKVPGPGLKVEWEEYGSAVKLANEELHSLVATQNNMAKNKLADHLRDINSAAHVGVKEAAAEWKALANAFTLWEDTQLKAGHKPTDKEALSEWQTLGQGISKVNEPKLLEKEVPLEKSINKTAFDVNETAKLTDQVSQIGLYSNAMKEASTLNHILEAARKANVTLTTEEIAKYKGLIATIVENKEYDKELEFIYKSLLGPTDEYSARIKALDKLHKDGMFTQDQYNKGLKEAAKAYNEASDASARFKRELDEQKRDAPNKLGSQQEIAVKSQLQEYDQQLRKPNADTAHPFGYSEEEIAKVNAALSPLIAAQQRKNEVDQAANALIYKQIDLVDSLVIKEEALAKAVAAGAMSQRAANAERMNDFIQQNNQQLKSGTGGNPFKGALAEYSKDFTTFSAGIKDTFAGVAKTLGDGFANSIGKWLSGTQKLGAALKDVARSAIGELISGLVRLGIEYLIVNVIMKKFHIKPLPSITGPSPKQAAEGIAGMGAITISGLIMTKLLTQPMWNLAGALAAVTFGASAIAGAAGIASVSAATLAAQNAGKADGGYISGAGTSRSDSILTPLSNGEYVVNALATSQHRDVLEAINSGMSPDDLSGRFAPKVNSLQTTSGTQGGKMNVQVHNYGSSNVAVEQMDEGGVRVIVNEMVPNLISRHAPGVIAGDIGNPNSKTSKAISRSTSATRIR